MKQKKIEPRTIRVLIDAKFTGLTNEKSTQELRTVFQDHLEAMGIAGGLKYSVNVIVEESHIHLP